MPVHNNTSGKKLDCGINSSQMVLQHGIPGRLNFLKKLNIQKTKFIAVCFKNTI